MRWTKDWEEKQGFWGALGGVKGVGDRHRGVQACRCMGAWLLFFYNGMMMIYMCVMDQQVSQICHETEQ